MGMQVLLLIVKSAVKSIKSNAEYNNFQINGYKPQKNEQIRSRKPVLFVSNTDLVRKFINAPEPRNPTSTNTSKHESFPLNLNKTTVHYPSPAKCAPYKCAPYKFAPYKCAPYKCAPYKCAPYKCAPYKCAPYKCAPYKCAPSQVCPLKVCPSKCAPRNVYLPMVVEKEKVL